jgi:hypothetical protein
MSEGWRRFTTVGQLRKDLEGVEDGLIVRVRVLNQATQEEAFGPVRMAERVAVDDEDEQFSDGPVFLITAEDESYGDEDEL